MDHVVPHRFLSEGGGQDSTEHLGQVMLITIIHLDEADTLGLELASIALWAYSSPDLVAEALSYAYQMGANEARGSRDEDTLHDRDREVGARIQRSERISWGSP